METIGGSLLLYLRLYNGPRYSGLGLQALELRNQTVGLTIKGKNVTSNCRFLRSHIAWGTLRIRRSGGWHLALVLVLDTIFPHVPMALFTRSNLSTFAFGPHFARSHRVTSDKIFKLEDAVSVQVHKHDATTYMCDISSNKRPANAGSICSRAYSR